ncbi:hypothetical protein FDECE_6271 [Neofusicoccum parvum]|uniref:Uncharacterized protein n=1 Tax=Neofusicoccum parvum TaxID=310453 RepID=A0ACB5SAZ7_9PEZI|nr:hypothetical protein FDECE_6271 [Neofusicoccum parvum]
MAATDTNTNAEMTRLRSSLERARNGGVPSIGQWMEFPGYTLARTVAALGEDWVLIDCEHGNIDDAEMYHAVGAVATAASDFPNGIRGAGGLFAPANFGVDAAEYVRSANRRIVVIVQIETRKAIENVEEIASVPGIDALFVGPNDLAASMGYFPFSHASIPEVQHATAQVLAAAQKHGKYAGHFALGAEAAAVRVKQGWHFVNCGADIVAVTAWMSNEMEQLKKMVSSKDE